MAQKIFIIFLIFLVALFPNINSDVVSVNSGGDEELIINPDTYIEGFFSCIPKTCSSLGVECGTASNSCGVTLDCGSCGSGQTCSSGICVTTTTPGGTGVGGGGGTIVTTTIKEGDLSINPSELSISVIEGVEEKREIKIRNIGRVSILITIEVVGEEIEGILTIEYNKTSLKPNEEKTLELKIKVEGKQLLIGKILMKYSGIVKEVPVVIGSKSENFLFDISVYLSDAFRTILIGEKLNAQFNLIQVDIGGKVDVVATYVIKDFEGNSYYEETETFFVSGEKNFIKEFPTQELQEGKYVLGFEVVYPGAFAVSSTTFNIEERKIGFNYKLILVLSFLIILILFIIWIIRIIKKKDIKLKRALKK